MLSNLKEIFGSLCCYLANRNWHNSPELGLCNSVLPPLFVLFANNLIAVFTSRWNFLFFGYHLFPVRAQTALLSSILKPACWYRDGGEWLILLIKNRAQAWLQDPCMCVYMYNLKKKTNHKHKTLLLTQWVCYAVSSSHHNTLIFTVRESGGCEGGRLTQYQPVHVGVLAQGSFTSP